MFNKLLNNFPNFHDCGNIFHGEFSVVQEALYEDFSFPFAGENYFVKYRGREGAFIEIKKMFFANSGVGRGFETLSTSIDFINSSVKTNG